MRTLPYVFLVLTAGLSLASFLTSETLAAGAISGPCALALFNVGF